MKILFVILTFSNAANVDESEILDELVLANEYKDLVKN